MSELKIAIIGGARFDQAKLDTFMRKLAVKHPDAEVITGSGRGSEQEVFSLAKELGMKVSCPPLHPEWYGGEALIIQVNDILIQAGHRDAVVVLVGTGARPTRAKEIIHRVDQYARNPRLVHEIAKMPVKEREPAPRRARKPVFD